MNPQKIFTGILALVYRASGGAIAGRMFGAPVLVLTSTGRKSGQRRTNPLMYLRDGDRLVLAASNGGSDRHPAWYLNLRANPKAAVLIGRDQIPVTAETASPDDAARLWPRFDQMYSGYAQYRR